MVRTPSVLTPAPADDDDPCATPNTTVTRRQPPRPLNEADRVPGLGPFAGTWNVHGSEMTLREQGPSTKRASLNFAERVETDTVRWTRYRNPARLLLVVTKVEYSDDQGRPAPEPSEACWLSDGSVEPGDSSLLFFAAPHLLEEMYLTSHVSLTDIEGRNGYWCGDGLDKRYQDRCGA
jgi:hypothetical protein